MNHVLDACAIIAFLRNEPGADVVRNVLLGPSDTVFVHAINLCEVCYDFFRAAGERTARSAIRDVSRIGVGTRRDMGQSFWREAGRIKAIHRKVSLADCFAIALANRLGAQIVTSDHHEMDPLAASGVCKVLFIR